MLKTDTVAKRTFEILKSIMSNDNFIDFNLFGGTALALQLGHRISVDLDFISFKKFDSKDLLLTIKEHYPYIVERINDGLIVGTIEGIKIDFVFEKSNLVNNIVREEQIRLLSKEDICAMKLMAISDNGTRERDFVDIAELSKVFTLNQMVAFFQKKYDIKSSIVPIKPLCDFSRIEHTSINMINKKYNWDDVEKRINEMVTSPDKIIK